MNKELYALQTIAKPRRWHFRMEKAHSHSAQLIQKEEKSREKKACTEFGENPLGLLFLRLCTRSGVPMCRGAVRAYRRSALRAHSLLSLQNVKVIFSFKVPRGFGLYNRASSIPPPPTAKLTNMGLTYLPSQPPGVTAVISVFWVREAFEDRAVGT